MSIKSFTGLLPPFQTSKCFPGLFLQRKSLLLRCRRQEHEGHQIPGRQQKHIRHRQFQPFLLNGKPDNSHQNTVKYRSNELDTSTFINNCIVELNSVIYSFSVNDQTIKQLTNVKADKEKGRMLKHLKLFKGECSLDYL